MPSLINYSIVNNEMYYIGFIALDAPIARNTFGSKLLNFRWESRGGGGPKKHYLCLKYFILYILVIWYFFFLNSLCWWASAPWRRPSWRLWRVCSQLLLPLALKPLGLLDIELFVPSLVVVPWWLKYIN